MILYIHDIKKSKQKTKHNKRETDSQKQKTRWWLPERKSVEG